MRFVLVMCSDWMGGIRDSWSWIDWGFDTAGFCCSFASYVNLSIFWMSDFRESDCSWSFLLFTDQILGLVNGVCSSWHPAITPALEHVLLWGLRRWLGMFKLSRLLTDHLLWKLCCWLLTLYVHVQLRSWEKHRVWKWGSREHSGGLCAYSYESCG